MFICLYGWWFYDAKEVFVWLVWISCSWYSWLAHSLSLGLNIQYYLFLLIIECQQQYCSSASTRNDPLAPILWQMSDLFLDFKIVQHFYPFMCVGSAETLSLYFCLRNKCYGPLAAPVTLNNSNEVNLNYNDERKNNWYL